MGHLVDYENATGEIEKALAAITVTRRKQSKSKAWSWATQAAEHATRAGISKALQLLGNERWPDPSALEEALLALQSKTKNDFRIFNASGHSITQAGVTVVDEHTIPNIDVTNPEEVQAWGLKIAHRAAPYIEEGAYLALPGMSLLATHVITAIHGLIGFYPRVAWAVHQDGQFRWTAEQTSDLQNFRLESRNSR
jgi:hypothetical protein